MGNELDEANYIEDFEWWPQELQLLHKEREEVCEGERILIELPNVPVLRDKNGNACE